jgi:Na+/H+ antiporter NhaD/arsenite permease-like protein
MPAATPQLLTDAKVLAASLVFFGSYVVFAIGKFPGMKIDRPGAAIIGAVLMVAFRIVDAQHALAAVDFSTIVLLFAMMLVVSNIRLAGFFDWVTRAIVRRLPPRHLLPTVIVTSGLLSAFLVNDIVCLVLTPLVIGLTRRLSLPAVPYVIAVATASNIGSVATITGNPQNILIGASSGIPYVSFLLRLGPVAVAGLVMNWAVIRRVHARALTRVVVPDAVADAESTMRVRAKPVVVLAGVLAAFLLGVAPALAASVGAALLLITRSVDPKRVYADIDWGLLIFFVGLFVIVSGAERAGLTMELLEPLTHWGLQRLPLFVTATAALGNIVSNVPAVMLLRSVVPQLADPRAGWFALAMASTLSGNLTVTGSVANIIVVERAAAEGVTVGFRDFIAIGVPVTLATLVFGTIWLALTG